MYKELCEGGTYHSGIIVPEAEIDTAPSEMERYCSMFSFGEQILDHVKINKSTKGYNGIVYAKYFWLDIDVKGDIEKARQYALKLIIKLSSNYNLSPQDLFIYFSGGKGFHVGINGKTFGEFKPSKDLPEMFKKLAQIIAGEIPVDTKIYESVRIFRMTNSKHSSGYYKIPLSYDELQLSVENIWALATKPRIRFEREKPISQIYANEALSSVWRDIKLVEVEQQLIKDSGFWKPTNEGNRNQHLFRMSAMLFDKSELSKQSVYDLVSAVNQQNNPPLENDEVKSIVESAFNKTSRKEKKTNLVIKPFAGWVDEYLEHLFHPSSNLTTGFPSFDVVLRHKLKGKLCCKVGYGGSKKSLSSLNAAMINIQSDAHVIYSTMEMSVVQLMNRITDYIVDGEVTNASHEIEKMARAQAERLLKEKVAPIMGNKLQVTQNMSLTCKEYDVMIERMIEETGRMDMLIVDGLSMMGGADTEVQRFSDNTKELKELANKYNIYIELICHVSKGADWHTRDLTDKVRGSEKIFDNCDFMITFSRLIDDLAMSESVEYLNEKGYVRFYDKRGTGQTINKIFKFNKHKLLIEESSENPLDYDSRKSKKEYSY